MKFSVTISDMSEDELQRLMKAYSQHTVGHVTPVVVVHPPAQPPPEETPPPSWKAPPEQEDPNKVPDKIKAASRVREVVDWARTLPHVRKYTITEMVVFLDGLKDVIPILAKCTDLEGRVRAIMELA